ncbi:hypothetical protein VSDG_05264 [Cytospora chrysosperma]|uniref:Trichothecene 3-O-acetyltransferase-like N-terminal domain-containing protein n=1 Tax=Cytospora chrysosperma TaxID=252740 RepID=A0A423VWY4_CYTCH|nr:hypothetical protein VSDG_05264 [Valsa sordida]
MSLYQDVIGQLPILKTFNHGLLIFAVSDEAERDGITEALEAAETRLLESFPWLGGAVVNEGSGPGNSGIYKLVPWPTTASSPNHVVRCKDLSDTVVVTIEEIFKANAPSSLLDGKVLCPYPGFPEKYEDTPENPEPIIAIQANFIKGGLLLNFSAQHNAIDASGMMQVMHLFAKALRKEDYTPSELEQGNRDRTRVIPLIAPGEPIKDHSHLRLPADFRRPPPPAPEMMPTWAYFRLHKASVPIIKALASERDNGWDPAVAFISTNDALSAMYWKCLASVRVANGCSPMARSKYGRALDTRRAMGLDMEYMGHMVYHANSFMTLAELAAVPLPEIACRLRADLNAVNNAFSVRSYATYIAGEADKAKVMYGGMYNPDTDVGSSAVPNAGFFHAFGPLGRPSYARRPGNLAPIPGCVYWMPDEGDFVPVLVCLKPDDLEGMKLHPVWSQYTEYLG